MRRYQGAESAAPPLADCPAALASRWPALAGWPEGRLSAGPGKPLAPESKKPDHCWPGFPSRQRRGNQGKSAKAICTQTGVANARQTVITRQANLSDMKQTPEREKAGHRWPALYRMKRYAFGMIPSVSSKLTGFGLADARP